MDGLLAFFLNCFVTLLSVIDPVGAALTLVALTPGDPPARRREQALRGSAAALLLLLLFTFLGGPLFSLFGISLQALMVAGGLILTAVALRMLEGRSLTYRSSPAERAEGEAKEDVALIPLAMPILAGPAAITAVMVFASRAEGMAGWTGLIAAELLAVGGTALVLVNAEPLLARLGTTGTRLLVRAMGVVLAAMGAEFVLAGLKGYFG